MGHKAKSINAANLKALYKFYKKNKDCFRSPYFLFIEMKFTSLLYLPNRQYSA